ncbi:uncharacterized protein LOC133424968 isoform X2 [Cololabis saira]|uniref:uncharacterized protein LOC133424968 isoform X2 n=1 Tax=Cololabis saira TaxID=129043 RepID=UPI002AD1D1DD|nr:uncharacterized protein LOC133424968 isoform X2 [Cololabis saira]
MDKLKKVLSGQDDGSDGSNILERANQASTLAWGTRMKGFLICFILGAFSSILRREPLRAGQYLVPDWSVPPAEDHVCPGASPGHRHHAGVPGADAVLCLLVEEQRPCAALLHPPVPGLHLVRTLLHPVCQGRRHEDVLPLLVALLPLPPTS